MKKGYLKLENWVLGFIDRVDQTKLLFWLIGSIVLTSLITLLIPDIPYGHDLTFHLSRISSLADGFRLGELSNVYPNYLNGYGYGNGLFYGDLFLYLPAIFVALGINVITAYKMYLVLLTLATTVSVYFCTKEIVKSRYAGVIAVLLCLLSSYRTVDIFVRAALAEVIAFIFIPLIILGLYHVLFENKKKWYLLSIGFAGCFLSHNISAVLMIGFTFLFVCFSFKKLWKEPSRLGSLIMATVVCIGMVGYFLIPMVEQIASGEFVLTTQTVSTDLSASTRSLWQVFLAFPFRQYDSVAGIGLIFIIILLLRFKKGAGNFRVNEFADQLYLFVLVSVFAITPLFPWELVLKIIPPIGTIQFSWRLFITLTIFLSILGGIFGFRCMKTNCQRLRFFNLCLVFSLCAFSLNIGQQYLSYLYHIHITGLYEPLELTEYSIGLGEYLPAGTEVADLLERGEVITSNNDEVLTTFARQGLELTVDYSNGDEETYLDLPLLYYKGYEADGLLVEKSDHNLVRVYVSDSEGSFKVSYEGTTMAKVTAIISILVTVGLAVYIVRVEREVLH